MPYYIVNYQNTLISIGYNPPSLSIYNANNVGAIISYWFEPFGPYFNAFLKNIVKVEGIIYDIAEGSNTLYLTTVSNSTNTANKWIMASSFTQANEYAVSTSPFEVDNCSSIISYGIVTFL